MPAGKLSFTQAEYRVREDGTWLTQKVGVVRSDGTDGAVSVRVTNSSAATPGRATRKIDFEALNPITATGTSQELSWASGEAGIKYAEFKIINDDLVEGNEFIPLSLGTYKGGAAPGAIVQANLLIIDDDSPIPAHRWNGTFLQFQNPDGSWGLLVDLKGDKGDRGDPGESGVGGTTRAQILFAEADLSALGNQFLELENPLLTIHRISVSNRARIRGYLNSEVRASDLGRPTYILPVNSEYNNPGMLFDLVLGVNGKSDLDFHLCPQVLTSKQKLFLTVENLGDRQSKINLAIGGIA